ncbi:MAG: hypothetical protein KGQ28_05025, partial [Hyphomicrobiales bacterium]|nr:hypothetical protein [Hyphomicrobiales bacterium]
AIAGTTYAFAGANPASTVSVGAVGAERTITNVAAGRLSATSTDAVNGSQLFALASALANAAPIVSNNASSLPAPTATGTDATAASPGATAAGTQSLAVGYKANASGAGSTATGPNTVASGAQSTANGDGATALGDFSAALGSGANAAGSGSQAIGDMAIATGAGSTAVGQNANASGANAIASGNGATASGAGSVASGAGANAAGANGVALGNGAQVATAATNSVAIGAGSVASAPNTVSFGSPGAERRLVNVAPGVNGTDAVNVDQLNAGIGAVANLANDVAKKAFGGIAGVAAFTPIELPDPKKFAWAMGVGGYHGYVGYSGQLAYRFGASHTMATAGIAINSGDWHDPVWRVGIQGQF